MATSGEDAVTIDLPATCTADVLLFGFPLQCDFDGITEVTFHADSHAEWVCPKCATTHSNHESDLDT